MDAATLTAPTRTANLLDRVFDVYFRHLLPLLLFSATLVVTSSALRSWESEGDASDSGSSFLRSIAVILLNALVSSIAAFAATRVVRADEAGERTDLAQLFGGTLAALPRLLVLLVLYWIATFGLMLLFIVPGVIFAFSAIFAPNVVAAGPLQAWDAIRRSRALMKGRWWRTTLRLVMFALPYLLLYMFFQYLPKSAPYFWLHAGLATLLYPLSMVGQALLYFDLEQRHQASEAERARRVLAMTPAPAPAPAYAASTHAGFDPDAFSAFEHRGWQSAAGAYRHGFSRLTHQAVEPLLDAAGVIAGAALLDVACGPGDLSAKAAERGARVIGVDFSPGMLALAREHHPGIEFRVADAEALPFPDQSFDAVTMGFLVGHLSHPDRALAEARRVLRPHRRLALAWWQPMDRAVAFGIVMDAVRAHGRTQVDLPAGPPFDQFSDPETLGRALEQAGFGDVRISSQPMMWRVETAEEVFETYLHGSVRTAGLLREQSPEQLLSIRGEVLRRIEELRGPGGIEMPMPCWVASGLRPS